MTDHEMTVIKVENDEASARIICGFLESCGIEARISEDDAGDQIPSLELTHGVKIFVPAGQAEEAKRLLAEPEPAATDQP